MIEDPRQKRTRTALAGALIRLLSDASLETISVAALCQEAGVHRTTFYGHARSIEEFAVDLLTRDVDTVATVDVPEDTDPIPPYARAMVDLLEHVAEERPLYRALLASPWGGSLRLAIDARLRDRVRLALEVFATRAHAAVPEQREEVTAFISAGLVGIIVLWAESDDTDAEGWSDRVQALMPPWWPVRGEDASPRQPTSEMKASQRR